MRYRASAIAMALTGAVCVAAAQTPAPPAPQATFRAGVDVVQFDVTVLDKDRHPVRGLTAADFTVTEAGQPRPIVAFTPVDIPPPTPPSAAWMRDVAPDVVVNDTDIDRLLVIVMDDAYSGQNKAATMWDPWILSAGKQIARDAISGLGPKDLAAVVYTFLGRPQNFTPDHAKLLEAVDKFRPKNSPYTLPGATSPAAGVPLGCTYGSLVSKRTPDCIVNTLRNVAAALPQSPPRRKVILFISQYDQIAGDIDIAQSSPLTEMFRDLQRANATIYAYSPGGLQLIDAGASDTLRALAENTGGRAAVNTNAPRAQVPLLFEETSAYYMLGVQTAPVKPDGMFHNVSIHVNRPGLDVVARKGYFAPTKASTKKASATTPSDAALAASFPTDEIGVSVSATAFAAREAHRGDIAVIVGIRPRAATPAGTVFNVAVTAFDKEWRQRASATQTVQTATATGPNGMLEVFARLTLPPGRYELRTAVDGAGHVGSVFSDLEFQDFSGSPLSVSGLLLSRTAGRTNLLSDLATSPTIGRTFGPGDRIAAVLRVQQGGRAPLTAVPVHVTIRDTADAVGTDARSSIAASAFVDRSASYQFALPLETLAGGEHLVTIEVGDGKLRQTRTARFTVQR